MSQRYNQKTEKFEDCERCSDVVTMKEGDRTALGPAAYAALTGSVLQLGTDTMRGQVFVAWELDGAAYESSWHHPHELDTVEVSV